MKLFLIVIALTSYTNLYATIFENHKTMYVRQRPIERKKKQKVVPQVIQKSLPIESARTMAIDILNRAANSALAKQNHNGLTIFVNVRNILKNANIKTPNAGYTFSQCSAGVLAYVTTIYGITMPNIYLCNLLVNTANTKYIAQNLIHEAAHIYGYSNECDATRVEIVAMIESGYGIVRHNAYVEPCGIL